MKKTRFQDHYTPEEFCRLPLSKAIPFVIEDMKRFTKRGVKLNMSSWALADRHSGQLCSVCAGGAAVLGFYNGQLPDLISAQMPNPTEYSPQQIGISIVRIEKGKHATAYEKISQTFNHIRATDYRCAVNMWDDHKPLKSEFTEKLRQLWLKHQSIHGELHPYKTRLLYKQMNEFAAVLAKHGY